jgi:hypothetical protein
LYSQYITRLLAPTAETSGLRWNLSKNLYQAKMRQKNKIQKKIALLWGRLTRIRLCLRL